MKRGFKNYKFRRQWHATRSAEADKIIFLSVNQIVEFNVKLYGYAIFTLELPLILLLFFETSPAKYDSGVDEARPNIKLLISLLMPARAKREVGTKPTDF